jgi:hypothetical protein
MYFLLGASSSNGAWSTGAVLEADHRRLHLQKDRIFALTLADDDSPSTTSSTRRSGPAVPVPDLVLYLTDIDTCWPHPQARGSSADLGPTWPS